MLSCDPNKLPACCVSISICDSRCSLLDSMVVYMCDAYVLLGCEIGFPIIMILKCYIKGICKLHTSPDYHTYHAASIAAHTCSCDKADMNQYQLLSEYVYYMYLRSAYIRIKIQRAVEKLSKQIQNALKREYTSMYYYFSLPKFGSFCHFQFHLPVVECWMLGPRPFASNENDI